MTPERIAAMPAHSVGFDTETHKVQAGLLAPPLVCGSVAWLDQDVHHLMQVRDEAAVAAHSARSVGDDRRAFEIDKQAEALTAEIGRRTAIPGQFLDKQHVATVFAQVIEDPERIIVGANIAYDMLVLASHLWTTMQVDALPAIFRAYAEDRVFDVQIAEALHAVAEGTLGKDPRNGGPLINPETGRRGRYALATLVDIVLDRKDAKSNDEWREKYALLDAIPIEQWPESAVTYPVDDARNTHEVALAQTGHVPKVAPSHQWVPPGVCGRCGSRKLADPCRVRAPHRNLHEVGLQSYTAFCLHLGAAWGFKVNQTSVDLIEADALNGREEAGAPFRAAGFMRADGTEDRAALKRAIARAYGAASPCPTCAGTGKVKSRSKSGGMITCCRYEDVAAVGAAAGAVVEEKVKTCDGTGLVLGAGVPRSDKEGVSYGRDIKNESGDETLMALADYQEDAKVLDVYVPYLRNARVHTTGHDVDGNPVAGWREIPLTLWPNVILETGRVSYGGVIQLFPRDAGYYTTDGRYIPSLRETIEARSGRTFSSEDFEAGEMITHGQSLIWITGDSVLARALCTGVKPHNALASTLLGMRYEDYNAKLAAKVQVCVDAKTAAKWGNFGFAGSMGVVKMAQTCRRQGPDTPHASGPHMVDDGTGRDIKVPGYKGLRFCLLMDGASYCGRDKKINEYRERAIPPTCSHCIECSKRLRDSYYQQWPEVVPYFRFVQGCLDDGMTITADALARWPHLRPWYYPGQQLAPGEIMHHVSGRIRGDGTYNNIANGFFQGLLADISKAALRRVARECYDSTIRVGQAHANSKRSRFHGGPSPLLGSRAIGFFHDELLMEHHDAVAHEGAIRVSEVMAEEMAWFCPALAVAAKAEPTLMKRWQKNATPWYATGKTGADGKADRTQPANEHDRLVPWQPKPREVAA